MTIDEFGRSKDIQRVSNGVVGYISNKAGFRQVSVEKLLCFYLLFVDYLLNWPLNF